MEDITWVNIVDIIIKGVQIVTTIALAIIASLLYKRQKKFDLEMQKKKLVYEKKVDAFSEVLYCIDTYISWLRVDNEDPIREKKNRIDMTLLARKCLNNLCIYCDNKETIELFTELLCTDKGNQIDIYKKLRESIREELGNKYIEFNDKRVFYTYVATDFMS